MALIRMLASGLTVAVALALSVSVFAQPARPPSPDPGIVLDRIADHVRGRVYHPALPDGRLRFERVEVHPQYVIENSVDRHHFRFVHRVPHSPVILEQSADDWTWRFIVLE